MELDQYKNQYMLVASALSFLPLTIWHLAIKGQKDDNSPNFVNDAGFKLSCFSHFFTWFPYVAMYLLRLITHNIDETGLALWITAEFSTLGPFFFQILSSYYMFFFFKPQLQQASNFTRISFVALTAFEIFYQIKMIPKLYEWYKSQTKIFYSQYLPPPLGVDAVPADFDDKSYMTNVHSSQTSNLAQLVIF